jgi:hypothetical protein
VTARNRDERVRCIEVALKCLGAHRPSGPDVADLVERERGHAAATALAVERVCIWLARIAELGAVLAYREEAARLKAALAADWLANGP